MIWVFTVIDVCGWMKFPLTAKLYTQQDNKPNESAITYVVEAPESGILLIVTFFHSTTLQLELFQLFTLLHLHFHFHFHCHFHFHFHLHPHGKSKMSM